MPETRITGGAFRGRVVSTPRGLAVRPTRGLVRESLFDILGARVVDATVLDLYAGAGTLGFEALSRGAAEVTFVERNPEALRCIAATAARFGCRERCHIARGDVLRWLRGAVRQTLRDIDICFVDTPYRDPELDAVLARLGDAPPRLVVCEHHERRQLGDRAGKLLRVREVRHGLTTITMLQPEPEATAQVQ